MVEDWLLQGERTLFRSGALDRPRPPSLFPAVLIFAVLVWTAWTTPFALALGCLFVAVYWYTGTNCRGVTLTPRRLLVEQRACLETYLRQNVARFELVLDGEGRGWIRLDPPPEPGPFDHGIGVRDGLEFYGRWFGLSEKPELRPEALLAPDEILLWSGSRRKLGLFSLVGRALLQCLALVLLSTLVMPLTWTSWVMGGAVFLSGFAFVASELRKSQTFALTDQRLLILGVDRLVSHERRYLVDPPVELEWAADVAGARAAWCK